MARQPRIDAGDTYETTREFDLPTTGDIIHAPNEEIITGEAVKAAGDLDYQAQLAFMEEKVVVMVLDTTDVNAEPMPAVYVNGVAQFFPRGQEVTCKRKFVEGLVRSKPEAISASVTERNSENPTNRILRRAAEKYPFQVLRDDNPRGHSWLQALRTEDRV